MRFTLLLLLSAAVLCTGAEPILIGKDTPNAAWQMPPGAEWLPDGTLKVAAAEPGRDLASVKPDIRRFAGKFIRISGEVKAENVSVGAKMNYGVKLMGSRKSNGLGEIWKTSENRLWGTFDWKVQELSLFIPEDIEDFQLHLGLEKTSGTAYFRKVKIEEFEGDLYPAPAPLPPGFQCEYSDAVRKMPLLRGVCVRAEKMDAEGIRKLGEWRCNVVRWWIEDRKKCADMKAYWPWVESELKRLEALMPELQKAGIGVILTVTVPGGRYCDPLNPADVEEGEDNPGLNNEYRTCFSDRYNREFQKLYRMLGKRYKDNPVIVGYDLMNEPTHGSGVKYDYLKSQYLAALALRENDPEKPIFVSCCEMGPPSAFAFLKPIPVRNVIYQVHMYVPGIYTHQRYRKEGKMLTYPGIIDGRRHDKAELFAVMKPVTDFEKKYGAIIYAGEYSVFRWVPGGARYLTDLTELFDQLGWHSTYHAFREWHGWSLEHSADGDNVKPVAEETDRAQVIRRYFKENVPYDGWLNRR